MTATPIPNVRTKNGTVHLGKYVDGELRARCNGKLAGTPTDLGTYCFRCEQGNGGGRITR